MQTLVLITSLALQSWALPIATAALTPAQFLYLGYNWNVQLPVASPSNPAVYTTSSQPGLQTFTSPNFYVNSTKNGAVFFTNNTGITTGGSDHPRTELREMCGPTGQLWNGWPSTGTISRQLNVTLKVDAVPVDRMTIIAQVFAVSAGAQHTYRVGSKLGKYYVAVCTKTGCTDYDSNYILGATFSLNIIVLNNQVTTTYQNWSSGRTFKTTTTVAPYSDYIFKTGNYCYITKGVDAPSAYCQAVFSSVSVTPC
ncbi:UNVERIFIED_CONTAM: hypothetical protein HDU68_005146 [Siphonaria sp. JEL0065]|nr:hypothetical protein HDU68_005146 [Siphonaria sp. JEL0065]